MSLNKHLFSPKNRVQGGAKSPQAYYQKHQKIFLSDQLHSSQSHGQMAMSAVAAVAHQSVDSHRNESPSKHLPPPQQYSPVYESQPKSAFLTEAQIEHAHQQLATHSLRQSQSAEKVPSSDQEQLSLYQAKGRQVRQEKLEGSTRSRDLQARGFITSYAQKGQQAFGTNAQMTKEALNANVLGQISGGSLSPQRQPAWQGQQASNQDLIQQRVFSKFIAGSSGPRQGAGFNGSPRCKQQMSPRTIQPRGLGATVPPPPSFTSQKYKEAMQKAAILNQQQYGIPFKANAQDQAYTDAYDDEEPNDGVSPSSSGLVITRSGGHATDADADLPSSSQVSKSEYSAYEVATEAVGQQQQRAQARESSDTAAAADYILKEKEFLSFGVGKMSQRHLLEQSQVEGGNLQRPTESYGHVVQMPLNRFAKENPEKRTIPRSSPRSPHEKSPVRTEGRLDGTQSSKYLRSPRLQVSKRDLNDSRHSPQSYNATQNPPPPQPVRYQTQKQQDDFIKKQQDFERRRQQKILEAQREKQAKEKAEFQKMAPFRPNLVTETGPKSARQRSLKQSPRGSQEALGRRKSSDGQHRSLQQFITDQQSYMFKSQKKLSEQRQQQAMEQRKEETHRPALNPRSKLICKRIQEAYFAQFEAEQAAEQQAELESQRVLNEAKQASVIGEQKRESDSEGLAVGQEFVEQRVSDLIDIEPISQSHDLSKQDQITPVLPSKAKKAPSNNLQAPRMPKSSKSPTAQKLMAQKKALARQEPEKPTFAPKINKQSQRIAAEMQKREEFRRAGIMENMLGLPQLGDPSQPHRPADLIGSDATIKINDSSPIVLEEHHRQAIDNPRFQTEPDHHHFNVEPLSSVADNERSSHGLILGTREVSGFATVRHTDQILTPGEGHPTAPQKEVYSQNQSYFVFPSSHDSLNISSQQNSKQTQLQSEKKSLLAKFSANHLLKKRVREEPRIAELKSELTHQRMVKEKQEKEHQSKRNNETLVLRNFKKELDYVCEELGLGSIAVSGQSYGTHPLKASKMSDQTHQTTKQHHYSSDSTIQEQVRVDIALLLHQLGFLIDLTAQPRASNSPGGGVRASSLGREQRVSLVDQSVCILDEADQKTAFKANLFTVLAAIQSINLKEHYPLFNSFGTLQHSVLEDITSQVDLGSSVYGGGQSNYSQSLYGGRGSHHGARGGRKSDGASQSEMVMSAEGLMVEAIAQLVSLPFPFQISHSHLVKMHLTFMSLFLNRKDSISRGHRHSLEKQEHSRFKFSPQITETQSSFSPAKSRTPLNEPNKYYDELKKNIKERAAKMSSLKAEKERGVMDECTFKPKVNPMSTRIAYKQVAEMHLSQNEFSKTYFKVEGDNSPGERKLDHDRHDEGKFTPMDPATAQIVRDVKKGKPLGKKSPVKQSLKQSKTRIDNRIDKLVREYVQDKKVGKRQDISTEQKEYERSLAELKFKPDIAKSQLSRLKSAGKRSPASKLERKSPEGKTLLMKGGSRSPAMSLRQSATGAKTARPGRSPTALTGFAADIKQKSLAFGQASKTKTAQNYSSKLKQQIVRRTTASKSPRVPKTKSEHKMLTKPLPKVKSARSKQLSRPQGHSKQQPPLHFEPTSPSDTNQADQKFVMTQQRLLAALENNRTSEPANFPQTTANRYEPQFPDPNYPLEKYQYINEGSSTEGSQKGLRASDALYDMQRAEVTDYTEHVRQQDGLMFLQEGDDESHMENQVQSHPNRYIQATSVESSEQNETGSMIVINPRSVANQDSNSAQLTQEEGSTAEFNQSTPQLGAPPSVADIQCFSNSLANSKTIKSPVQTTGYNSVAAGYQNGFQTMQGSIQEEKEKAVGNLHERSASEQITMMLLREQDSIQKSQPQPMGIESTHENLRVTDHHQLQSCTQESSISGQAFYEHPEAKSPEGESPQERRESGSEGQKLHQAASSQGEEVVSYNNFDQQQYQYGEEEEEDQQQHRGRSTALNGSQELIMWQMEGSNSDMAAAFELNGSSHGNSSRHNRLQESHTSGEMHQVFDTPRIAGGGQRQGEVFSNGEPEEMVEEIELPQIYELGHAYKEQEHPEEEQKYMHAYQEFQNLHQPVPSVSHPAGALTRGLAAEYREYQAMRSTASPQINNNTSSKSAVKHMLPSQSSELASHLLKPGLAESQQSPHLGAEQPFSKSAVGWTSEFARAVDDCITIENSASQKNAGVRDQTSISPMPAFQDGSIRSSTHY